MPYRAAEPAHFRKVAAFMDQWKSDGRTLPFRTMESLLQISREKPWIHILVNEDREGKVRAVLTAEERGAIPGEPKIAVNACLWLDVEDLQAEEMRYAKELLDWSFRYAWEELGIPLGEFWAAKPSLDLVHEVAGDEAMEVFETEDIPPPIYRRWRFTIDFRKYVETH